MQRDDEEQDDDVGQSGGYGAPSNGTQYDKTSDFNTLISDDNRLFGIKLSPEMAKNVRLYNGAIVGWLRVKAEQYGVPMARAFAKSIKHPHPEQFANKAGNYIGYGVILSTQLYDVGKNISDSVNNLNKLRIAVQPLADKGNKSAAPLSGNNEVVANARAKLKGIFTHKLLSTVVGTIRVAPNLISKFSEQQAKNLILEEAAELEQARKDPEALRKYLAKKAGLHLEGGVGTELDVKEALISARRKEYEAKHKAFLNDREVTKAIEKQFELKPDDLAYQLEKLKRFDGMEDKISQLEESVKACTDDMAVKGVIRAWEIKNKGPLKRVRDEAATARFVKQYGAFDDNWTKYYTLGEKPSLSSENRKERLTYEEEITEKLAKINETVEKTKQDTTAKPQDLNGLNIGEIISSLAAGLVSENVTSALGGKTLEKYQQPVALDRILHLRRTLEKAKDNAPEMIPANQGTTETDMGYAQYVHAIFQQHQRDCNRTEIGERFVTHMSGADWNDEAIQKIPDEELSNYEYAVKTIAKRIQNGQMDAIALITLVGDKQKKIVHDDAHSFGPKGNSKDEVAAKKAILHIIDEQTAILNSGQEQTDKEINDKLGNFIFSVEDMKKALESKEMDAGQRSFIFTVFSDVVGSSEALCKKLGISKERCHELRKEAQDAFAVTLDGAVLALADMIEKEPKVLEKTLKLTDKEKELITSLADHIREDDKDVGDIVKDSKERQSIEAVVANAAITKPPGFWSRLIEARNATKEAKAAKEEQKRNPGLEIEHDSPLVDRDAVPRQKSKEQEDEGFSNPDEPSHSSRHPKRKQFTESHKPRESWEDNVVSRSREDSDSVRPIP